MIELFSFSFSYSADAMVDTRSLSMLSKALPNCPISSFVFRRVRASRSPRETFSTTLEILLIGRVIDR